MPASKYLQKGVMFLQLSAYNFNGFKKTNNCDGGLDINDQDPSGAAVYLVVIQIVVIITITIVIQPIFSTLLLDRLRHYLRPRSRMRRQELDYQNPSIFFVAFISLAWLAKPSLIVGSPRREIYFVRPWRVGI